MRTELLRRYTSGSRRAGGGAGYSGTPLPRKLGIKPGHSVLLAGAPPDFESTLGDLAEGVRTARRTGPGPYDVILLFAYRLRTLERRLGGLKPKLGPSGGLWICWPKKSSGLRTDLAGGVVRESGLASGLVDNKVCAVDETWSGLRFVYRLADRPSPSP